METGDNERLREIMEDTTTDILQPSVNYPFAISSGKYYNQYRS